MSRVHTLGLVLFILSPFYATSSWGDEPIFYYQNAAGEIFFADLPEHQGFSRYGIANLSRSQILTLDQAVQTFASRYRMDPLLIRAVIKAESNFNPVAVSRSGAKGLMQIMPITAQVLGLTDPFDASANIAAGTRYLSEMLQRFSGDLSLALAAYNAGPTIVKKYGKVPPYPETIHYIRRVLMYYDEFKSLS